MADRLRRVRPSGLVAGLTGATSETTAAASIPWRIASAAGVAVGVLALAVLLGYPVLQLAQVALGGGPAAWLASFAGVSVRAIGNTLGVALAVSLLTVLGGTVAALAVARIPPGRHRDALRVMLLLPLLMPPFVTAIAWDRAYGRAALLDHLGGFQLPGLEGPAGIVAVLAVTSLPLAYLVVAAGLATHHDPDTERAARASGAGPWACLWTVTLPLIRAPLLAAGLLVFVTSINAFGVPAVLGTPARFSTITTRIFGDLAFSADPQVFQRIVMLAGVLVVMALVAAAFFDRWATPSRFGAAPSAPVPAPSRHVTAITLGIVTFAALTTVVPLAALLLTALTRGVGLAPLPGNLTLDNFRAAVAGAAGPALTNTVGLSTAAATIAVSLGCLAWWVARRARGRPIAAMVTVGFALPGSTVALAVLMAYGGWLRDSLLLILVAYVAKFWALGLRPIAGAADRLPADLARAARVSGASALVALRSVVVPILWPALAAAWLLVFLFGLHELTMSVLLYGPHSQTLAVVVLNLQQLGDPTVTAALGVVLTLVGVAALLPLRALGGRSRIVLAGE